MPIWIGVSIILSICMYYHIIPWQIAILCLVFTYWLPKKICISPLEILFPQVLFRNSKNKNIALTVDDLPFGSEAKIIEVLNKYNMKGTFFIVSGDINDSNIHVFVDAVKNGHQLGNHGKTNSPHFLKNEIELREEIKHCDNMIKRIYSMANKDLPMRRVYRPGSGVFGNLILKVAAEMNYELALGSVFPYDPVIVFSNINYWYLKNHIESGDVVVLHDRSWTPKMLDKLLPWLIKQNLTSVTLENFN